MRERGRERVKEREIWREREGDRDRGEEKERERRGKGRERQAETLTDCPFHDTVPKLTECPTSNIIIPGKLHIFLRVALPAIHVDWGRLWRGVAVGCRGNLGSLFRLPAPFSTKTCSGGR